MSSHRFLLRTAKAGPACAVFPDAKHIALDGFDLFVNATTPVIPLERERGCIVGFIVFKGTNAPITRAIRTEEAQHILATRGEALCRNYWGAYCAILLDRPQRHIWIVRDPSGALPCYQLEQDGGILLASDLDLIFENCDRPLGVDWRSLARFLYASTPRRIHTCVEGVTELRPGFATPLHSRSDADRQIWSPWPHTSPRDRAATGEELEAIVRQSVAALAKPYDRVLVAASGGLDSSIVAASLRLEGQNFDCFTMATDEPSGDERPYARLVADHLQTRLIDRFYDPDRVDLLVSSASHLPRPVGKYFMQEMRRGLLDAVTEAGARAVFTGNGGDNVFCYLHSARPILDRIHVEGWTKGIWQTLVDMCRVTGADLFTMARLVARELVHPVRSLQWTGDSNLLQDELDAKNLDDLLEPHLHDPSAGPLGKAQHIAMVMRIRNYIEGDERATSPAVVAPLVSQPVVEFCLSVPTWQWASGGINRSLARKAFNHHLPPQILTRTAKAGPDSFTAHLFVRNRPVLRSMLLDGLLAGNGIIDRRAVEVALADPAIVQAQGHHRLLMLAEAEAWSRSILDRKAKQARL